MERVVLVDAICGESINEDKLKVIADGAFEKIVSELSEEIRTYDMALYVVSLLRRKIEGSKIAL